MNPFQSLVSAGLPDDADQAALAGRAWRPELGGPSVVALRDGLVFDITERFPTMRDLCEAPTRRRRCAAPPARRWGRSTRSWRTRRWRRVTAPGHGCWRPSICRRSRPPA